jgi:cytosine/adenosine deaminase-related metal-dependent hydrolase
MPAALPFNLASLLLCPRSNLTLGRGYLANSWKVLEKSFV